MSETYDVVIVGGGAAGLSGALVLARARRRVAVVGGGAPRNAPAEHMHGFLSRDGMPPAELLAHGAAEAAGYGAELIDDVVIDAERTGESDYTLRLGGGATVRARRVLVATGLRDELPQLPGVRERWGRDVLHCPYCHGYEVRDQPIGVLGGPEPGARARAVHLALLLPQWSDDVIFFPNTMPLSDGDRAHLDARGVRVLDGEVAGFAVDDRLRGVELADGRAVPRTAMFVAPTFRANDAVLVALGCAFDDSGWVVTDATGRTSVPGVWAAGNVSNPAAQVISAAGAGSTAAIAINGDLVLADAGAFAR
ncbi:NAD(P)/FAD-dependent oxidoreductase [Nocardia gipuzkoensis]|uniref:NAD(P)/FAD-dependent oxidoreductase n=1 Tax=Nocardia TaxID=1817 RepID=UPI001895A525|nr:MULTISPECIES: NAD(P)/FAD-dependent oxidoreductase [Nocardia]MBF6219540.1 NAD(P)/FAD-dependent oxidoreductase [Nocardia abscessus]MDE1673328.1 NAD(P)/FAD-dependent oxidoreductase [Nocardia gipuzkoensis]